MRAWPISMKRITELDHIEGHLNNVAQPDEFGSKSVTGNGNRIAHAEYL